jgi:hypothetical protein
MQRADTVFLRLLSGLWEPLVVIRFYQNCISLVIDFVLLLAS